MTRIGAILLLAALQIAWAAPARAIDPNAVHVVINVFVVNASNGTAVPSREVQIQKLGKQCGAPQYNSETNSGGAAKPLPFWMCPGFVLITVPGGDLFKTYQRVIQIVPGQETYNVAVALEPKPQSPTLPSNKYLNQTDRILHIRVQGRMPDGSLVPVHYATILDLGLNRLGSTGYDGTAIIKHKEAIGELVTLRAEAGVTGKEEWKPATASFIVGAAERGLRTMRSEDYVNFILGGNKEPTEEHDLDITVWGLKANGARTAVRHAEVYDSEGHLLASTGYNGRATARVKTPLGENYTVKAEASHWKPATETVQSGSTGGISATYAHDAVTFVLEPERVAPPLTVEVLNHDTDKPVAAATVTLYKPSGFPGKAVAHSTTNAEGLATFAAEEVDSALLNGDARVGATHGGAKSAIQTIAGSLLSGESPHYLIYLKSKTENTRWSGTWYEGPFTVQVSGGTGSLGFTSTRAQGVGTCCPLTDNGGGSCTVKGNTATCKWHMLYSDIPPTHDGGKQVDRSGHGTLTFVAGRTPSEDSISYKFHQDTGTITLGVGTCPDINQCTGMHPGAENSGSWSRKKP
jgi:hypothetical protein